MKVQGTGAVIPIKAHGTVRRAGMLLATLFALVMSSSVHGEEMGRTQGNPGVSESGAATYTIPLWTPPGPRGVQPILALTYDSQSGNGTVGVGWSLSGFGSIERCAQTLAEDGQKRAVNIDAQDRFCLNGNKLRITSGPLGSYGTAGAVYQTQIANFARITSVGTAGTGPQFFRVHTKDGLIYEYGNTPDSNVVLSGSTVFRWLLNKVSDREGNSYTITYSTDNTVGRVPLSVQWGPTGSNETSYQYKASFNYSNKTIEKDIVRARVGNSSIVTKQRLNSIEIGYSSSGSTYVTKRQYILTYETSPTTSQSRLVKVKECAASASTCLKPTIIAYQNGAAGVSGSASTALPSSASPVFMGKYDFNGDGRNDIAFFNGATWRVAFSNGAGFSAGVDTGIGTTPLVGRFVATHQDGFLANVSGVWSYVGYNGVSFTTSSTGTAVTAGSFLSDFNGDGLSDFVWKEVSGSTATVKVQLNTTTGSSAVPSFASAAITALAVNLGSFGGNISFVSATECPLERQCDINGDRRADLTVVLTTTLTCGGGPGGCTPVSTGYDLLTSGSGYVLANGIANSVNPYLGLKFNDDQCMDSIRLGTTTLRVASCGNGAVADVTIPAQPTVVMDWDGDKKTDLLVVNGGTFGVYRSRGSSSSPFDALATTTIPVEQNCHYYALDVDGDGLDELACALTVAPFTVKYYTHNGGGTTGIGGTEAFATQIPDLAISVTDGFDVAASYSYVSTSQSNRYVKGSGTTLPLVDATDSRIIVAKLTVSDGAGGAYDLDYSYEGARRHGGLNVAPTPGESLSNDAIYGPVGQWAGFEKVTVADSRNSLKRSTGYEQMFPRTGMVKAIEVFRPNGGPKISSITNTNVPGVLDSTAYNQRYFNYVSDSSIDQYEVGGALDGQLITHTLTTFTYAAGNNFTYGNPTTITTETTDKDSTSPLANYKWTTTVTNTYASPLTSGTDWCVGMLTEVQTVQSSNAPGVAAVTRTIGYTPDSAAPGKCRVKVKTIEPASDKYRVTQTYEFDAFGNIKAVETVGRKPAGSGAYTNMSPRTTKIDWGATGQFPSMVTDATDAVTRFDYNLDLGTVQNISDPNSTANNLIQTSFLYDDFGRKKRETRANGTYTTWDYDDCTTSGCIDGNHRMTVAERTYDNQGGLIDDRFSYLDAFERPLVTRSRLVNGAVWNGSYQWAEVQYDEFGRVRMKYMPCIAMSATQSCRSSAETYAYDLVGRTTQVSRPRSEFDATVQSTSFDYAGRTQSVTDAMGKTTVKATSVDGSVRKTTDANGYSVNFENDAAGSVREIGDSQSRLLLSGVTMEYGIQPFIVAATDAAHGALTRTYDSLGELVGWTDAKDQSFSATYDNLSRLVSRVEPDTPTTSMTTTFIYGSSATNFNIGRLQSVSSAAASGTYSETYTYDDRARLKTRSIAIPGDGTYNYDYNYEPSKGWLDSLTYPASTSGYRLKLKYGYQNGKLIRISDANDGATVFWTANASNAFGQVTQEILGNGIITNRTFDAVTGWLSTIQSGPSGNTTAVQNAAYLYDQVGNVIQRQNNTLGLTESFDYGSDTDHVYRLSESRLDSGSGEAVNLSMTYDDAGNVLTRNEPGRPDVMIPHTVTWTGYNLPSQISTLGETVNFAYGPQHQRWKMVYARGGSNETTLYIGDLMEKVVGSSTIFRHTIVGGSGPVAIYSRTAGGSNTLRYVLTDRQGSIDAITNASNPTVGVINESFTAFGERRDAADWSGEPANRDDLDTITRQGYTYQTVLGAMGMNHMNGRVQDAVTGRFLSPDPFVMEPGNTQNWNRYAYVYNNPMTYVDPSGFMTVCWSNWNTPGGTAPAGIETVTTIATGFRQCAQVPDDPSAPPGASEGSVGGGGGGGGGGEGNASVENVTVTAQKLLDYAPCLQLHSMLTANRVEASANRVITTLEAADNTMLVTQGMVESAAESTRGDAYLQMTSDADDASALATKQLPTNANTFGRYVPALKVGAYGLSAGQLYLGWKHGGKEGLAYASVDATFTNISGRFYPWGTIAAVTYNVMGGFKSIVSAEAARAAIEAQDAFATQCALQSLLR